MSRIIFVTGTDTGVGKTLLVASLLYHLRKSGVRTLAMKPFSSGGTEDVELIEAIQGNHLPRSEVNPFSFRAPLAPWIAAKAEGRGIPMRQVVGAIHRMARRSECLIVEGAGGLLTPLGRHFSAADLILALRCDVMIVGSNRLGILNHTLLTVEALRARGVTSVKIVLMGVRVPDASARSNALALSAMLAPVEVLTLPYLGARATAAKAVERNSKKIKKTLARLTDFAIVSPRSLERRPQGGPKHND